MNLWLGLVFAACARFQFRAGEPPWRPTALMLVSFEGIVMWPVVLYFHLVHGDWLWLYTRPGAARLSWPLVLVVLLAALASLCVGWVVGWVLVKRRLERALEGTLVGLVLIALGLVAALHRRLFHYGSYDDFVAGHTVPIGEVKLPWVLALATAGIAIAALTVGWKLWSTGRRPNPGPAQAQTASPTPSIELATPSASGTIDRPARTEP